MSSSNYENVIIRTNTEGKGLVKDWEKIMGEFLDDMRRIEALPEDSAEPMVKLLELFSIKGRYNLRGIPSDITMDILQPELDKLKDVLIEDTDEGIRIKADYIEVHVKTGHDRVLECENTMAFLYPFGFIKPLNPVEASLLKHYQLYKAKQIGKFRFTLDTSRDFIKLRNRRKTVFHKVKLFLEGLYSITFEPKRFDELIEHDKATAAAQIANDEKERKNEERIRLQDEILARTGLDGFIRNFREHGIDVRSKGVFSDFNEERLNNSK